MRDPLLSKPLAATSFGSYNNPLAQKPASLGAQPSASSILSSRVSSGSRDYTRGLQPLDVVGKPPPYANGENTTSRGIRKNASEVSCMAPRAAPA